MGDILKFPEHEKPENTVIDHLTNAYYDNQNTELTVIIEDLLTGISWEAPVPETCRAKIIKIILDDFKRYLKQDSQ